MESPGNNRKLGVGLFGSVLAAGLLFLLMDRREAPLAPEAVDRPAVSELGGEPPPRRLDAVVESELQKRRQLDATVWSDEVLAQRHEEVFVNLWDRLRTEADPFDVLRGFPFREIAAVGPGGRSRGGHGVEERAFAPDGQWWSAAEFGDVLETIRASGIEIVQSEWHHGRFDRAAGRSRFSFEIHARHKGDATRHILRGKFDVDWAKNPGSAERPRADRIHPVDVRLLSRRGEPAFREVTLPTIPLSEARGKECVMATDFDGDGLPDLAFPQLNFALRNLGEMRFERRPFLGQLPPGVGMHRVYPDVRAVAEDFTGDGELDVVFVVPGGGVWLYRGSGGRFDSAPTEIGDLRRDVDVPSVVTAGDVNGDGRPDLFLGQYRGVYMAGFTPDRFYDANNSGPAFLLLNRGGGRFEDATEAAGLGAKRNRFCYAASVVDLDDDGDEDLFTVNDFSGVDVFLNDGTGKFADAADTFLDERANFGMAHALADFDNDARLDLYVNGMSSTTARRLQAMGLRREDQPDIDRMRMPMAYGNRVYLGGPDGMRQPPWRDQVARTGWAWGVAAFDFANDGSTDLYVANGHISAASCKDYCTQFWTHDVYARSVKPNPVLAQLNEREWARRGDISWNGYEKNVLLANAGGTNFSNLGFLLDVAFEYDSRSVLAEDFDRDGRMDLLVTESDSRSRDTFQRVHLYRNTWSTNGNWIGVRLRPTAGQPLAGTRVRLVTADRKTIGAVVTGDSFRVQHSFSRHFGLGEIGTVKRIEVDWPGAARTVLENPAINRYHEVKPAPAPRD